MKMFIAIWAVLVLSGCATVPDSVKIALEKEGAAINAVESDYRTSVEMYHSELLKQIDGRLDDTFRCQLEKIELKGGRLTASDVTKLEESRAKTRERLMNEAESAKRKYLSSMNLQILKALHAKVLQYASADRFSASDFATVLTALDGELDKIKAGKE